MKPSEFYEGVADRYDTPSHEAFYRKLAEELVALVPPGAEVRSILEVGAGTGFGTLVLRERFPEVPIVAVEPSASMIEHAVTRVPDAEYVRCALAELALNRSFDLVACFVAEHWLTHAERRRMIGLGRGGVLAVSAPLAPPRPLAPGNRMLRDAVLRTRSRGCWSREHRREPVPRGALDAASDVVQRDVTVVERYETARALAESLYERGSLMAVAGDAASTVRDDLAACDARDVEFEWKFRLAAADLRPSARGRSVTARDATRG